MKKSLNIIVIVAITGALGMGCVHTKLGQGPLDTDLLNDGSPEAQQQLVDEYRLSLSSHQVKRPAANPVEHDVDALQASVHSDEVHDYLRSSERAAEELDTPAVAFSRLVSSDAFKSGVILTFAAAGAAVAASAFGPTAADFFTSGGQNSDEALAAVGSVGLAMFWGGAVGALGSFPLLAMNSLLMVPFADGVAEADYREAVAAYNQDLTERVARLEAQPNTQPGATTDRACAPTATAPVALLRSAE